MREVNLLINDKKTIKDLKERNNKLKNQYELLEIKYEALLLEYEKNKELLVSAIKRLGSYQFKIKKAVEIIETNTDDMVVLAKCNMLKNMIESE